MMAEQPQPQAIVVIPEYRSDRSTFQESSPAPVVYKTDRSTLHATELSERDRKDVL